jgi:proteasome lid subunit RPN8/RPN11
MLPDLDSDDRPFHPFATPAGRRDPDPPPDPAPRRERDQDRDEPPRRLEALCVSFLDTPDVLLCSQAALEEVLQALRERPPEAAGLLLGPRNHELVTHFLPDEDGEATPASFTLAGRGLTLKLKPYLAAGLDCKGIAHSHPAGITCLSSGDLLYVQRVFQHPKNAALQRFCMPVVAGGRLYPYVVLRLPEGGLGVRPARILTL